MVRQKHLAEVLEEIATRIRLESPDSGYGDDHFGEEIFRKLEDNGFVIVRPIRWGDLG